MRASRLTVIRRSTEPSEAMVQMAFIVAMRCTTGATRPIVATMRTTPPSALVDTS